MMKPLRVLVTRPEHQSSKLSSALQIIGAEVILFPTLKIIPLQDKKIIHEIGKNINEYDVLIFISANSVFNAIPQWDVSLIKSTVVAMGSATKQALEEGGINTSVMPHSPYTSESLLNMSVLQHIEGKKILLVAGEGGRPLLENELKQRGALVRRLVVYKRECPASNPALLQNFWADDVCRVIVCTSGESVENLVELTPLALHPQLKNTALLVVSPRIKELATSLNKFTTIMVADNASDEAILAKIRAWYNIAQ